MGCAASVGRETNQVHGANGPLRKGVRAQTIYDERGGDNKWYVGTIMAVYESGKATIKYDDGDSWTGQAVYIYVLPPGHPGEHQRVAMGADTQAGPPGLIQSVASPAMHQPAPMPVMAPAGGGMAVLTTTATVPAGHTMQVHDPSGAPMNVQVPPGIAPGQQFQFQVATPMGTGSAAPIVVGQPIIGQPMY